MKIKTNLRAGSGGSSSSTDTSTSVSNKQQNQGGKADPVPVVYYTRCAGI